MSRDYKASPRGGRGSAQGGKKGGGLMAGLLIGLIVGVGAVVGTTMYLNRSSTPFSNLQKQEARQQGASEAGADVTLLEPGTLQEVAPAAPAPVAPSAPVTPAPDAAPPAQAPAAAPDAAAEEGNRFDFYKILPGKLDAVPATPDAPAQAPQPKRAQGFSLQAGAFANEAEADNLKAKLALMGVEANIQTVETANGLMHRVRVGPFARQTDAERVRNELKAGGVPSDLIKP
ncbi:SPOR domain-containing protein [Crenobacter intestini]|nr:SPOR domain-containing protein [Crenobacter intestini]